jgi:hypothetical protein
MKHVNVFHRFLPIIIPYTLAAFLLVLNVRLYLELREAKADPIRAAQEEADAIIAAVRTHMVLPDETPTIATVTDPEKLSDQPFFQQAKKGDKVLSLPAQGRQFSTIPPQTLLSMSRP